MLTNFNTSSSSKISTLLSSWLVLKPSKKCKNGKLPSIALKCEIIDIWYESCTEEEANIQKPVLRVAYISWWSPNIDNAWVAKLRAATWITPGNISPAILYIVGIINNNPCDAVNVVAKLPAWSAPCVTAAAPASLCISITLTVSLNKFNFPALLHLSVNVAIGLAGVIG